MPIKKYKCLFQQASAVMMTWYKADIITPELNDKFILTWHFPYWFTLELTLELTFAILDSCNGDKTAHQTSKSTQFMVKENMHNCHKCHKSYKHYNS